MSGNCPGYSDTAWLVIIYALAACLIIFVAVMMIYGAMLYAGSEMADGIAWEYVPLIGAVIFIGTITAVFILGLGGD